MFSFLLSITDLIFLSDVPVISDRGVDREDLSCRMDVRDGKRSVADIDRLVRSYAVEVRDVRFLPVRIGLERVVQLLNHRTGGRVITAAGGGQDLYAVADSEAVAVRIICHWDL